MNRYTPDNSAIIDATGKEWPVETAHELPLPNGIDGYEPGYFCTVVFAGPDSKWSGCQEGATHWLARRPLPEVPRVKTQEELDREAYQNWLNDTRRNGGNSPFAESVWHAAIAYARQCPAKPAA